MVALDSLAVPAIEAACTAAGSTCARLRQAIAAVDCTAKHILTSLPTCKTFHYVDGTVAGGAPQDLVTAGLAMLVVGRTVWCIMRMRK